MSFSIPLNESLFKYVLYFKSGKISDTVFKNYTNSNEEKENINRTQGFIEQAFQSGAATCLICISKIKRDDQVKLLINCTKYFVVL